LKFKLANDITLDAGVFVPYVSGYLDATGKTITNLTLSQNTSNLGFIGYFNGRTVTTALDRLTMSNASVLGKLNIGTEVGTSYLRAITNANAAGSVTGSDITYTPDPGDTVSGSGSNAGYSNVGGVVGLINASSSTTNALNLDTSSVTVSGGTHVGGIVGRLNTGTLTNSTSSGSVTGTNQVGGLAGRVYLGAVTGSSSTSAVTGTVNYTGGLVGYLESTSSSLNTSSHTTGLVKGVSYVGGLIGQSDGAVGVTVVSNTPTYTTFVTSNLEASGNYVGGLIGNASNGSVTNSSVSGTVTGWGGGYGGSYFGGLIGQSSATTSWNKYVGTLVKGSSYTGGLIGINYAAVSNSFSTGEVQSNSNNVGGLVGWTNSTITGTTATTGSTTYATGNVTGGDSTGGLLGYSSNSSNAVVSYAYATGNVTGTSNVGGLVGYLYYYGGINNATAYGNVTGTSNNVGGLAGYSYYNTINATAANGTVSGVSYVGGLVGYVYSSSTISNSTANNLVTGSYGVRGTGNQIGGLVGYLGGSTVTGSTANTVVLGSGVDVGGFIGQMSSSTVNTSGASGSVTGAGSVGGFVGTMYNSSNITSSYGNSKVTSTGANAGGFVGYFNASSNITNSRAAGAVSGTSYVGGFVGLMTYNGGISASYATGMVNATGDGAGGFLGYSNDTTYTRTLQDFYATGAVTGTTNVGGLVGYAARGTFSYGYSTGMVSSTSNATSVGASFGGVGTGTTVTGTAPNQVTTYWVIRNNLYYDSTTSGMSTDAAGVGGTGPATGLATSSLLGALPHANFVTATWGTGTDLYPYLKAIYGSSAPQAIWGYAYLADGTTKAVKAQVGVYGGGYLLNGGTMTTGANGFFYELLANTTGSPLFADSKLVIGTSTKLANTLSLAGSPTVVGMAYSDTQVLTNNNLVIDGSGIGLGKVMQGLTKLRTADASMSVLNTTMDSIMGSTAGTLNRSVFATTLPTNSSLELTSTVAAFDLNTALTYGKTTASNAGLMTFNGLSSNGTTFTLSGGTYTSNLTQSYNGLVTLGANATLTGTQITTASTVAGSANRYNLTVNGPLTTGGSMTNLGVFNMNGLTTLGGTQVTSGGTQTYSGNVVMQDSGSTFGFNSTLGGTGAAMSFAGTLTSPTTKALTLNAGATGDVTLATALANTVTYTDVTVTGANLSLQAIATSNSLTLNPTVAGTVGVISGASSTLTKGAAGMMNLTAANTYGGNTTITAGALKLTGSGSLGAGTYAGNVAISSGAQLQDSSSTAQTLSGIISGAGQVVKDTSTSVLTLSGLNTWSGNLTVNTGTVVVTQNNGLGNNAGTTTVASGAVLDLQNAAIGNETLNLNGGTLRVSTGSSSLSGAVNLGAASTLDVSGTGLTLSGLVDDNGYGLTVSGAGGVTLSNANNTVNTLLSTGTIGSVSMKNSVALDVGAISATGNVTIANTANLTLMSGQGISTTTGNIVLAGAKFFNRAGASALSVSNGHTWQVWSANIIPLETEANGGDENGGLVNNYVQYGATYGSSAVLGTGNGLLYTYAPTLTGSLVGTLSKPYDGTDNVVIQPSNIAVTGLLNGDVLSVTQTTNSHYTSVGSASTIIGVGTGKQCR